MKILFLTQILPFPLSSGAKVRAYYMLRYLAQDHQITLASFTRPDDGLEDVAHLRQFCQQVITVPIRRTRLQDITSFIESLITGQPAVVIRDRIPGMQKLLKNIRKINSFDVIHADQTAMAQYALFARAQAIGNGRPKILLDEHNALFHVVRRQAKYEKGYRRVLWNREADLLKYYERNLCRSFDQLLTVTEEDRETLLELFPKAERVQITGKIMSVPICIEPDGSSVANHPSSGLQIVHLGTMFWPPNVEAVLWFVREVLPLVIDQIPDVRFAIAGKNPPAAIQDLGSPQSKYCKSIEVMGYVHDPASLISESRVFVVPVLAGGGMRVKILDAWKWGIPVVSTSVGAEGIKATHGEDIFIADEPKRFAEMVVKLLLDERVTEKLIAGGRRSVEQHYNWRTTYKAIDLVYQELAEK